MAEKFGIGLYPVYSREMENGEAVSVVRQAWQSWWKDENFDSNGTLCQYGGYCIHHDMRGPWEIFEIPEEEKTALLEAVKGAWKNWKAGLGN